MVLCSAAIMAALVLGVGLASGLVLRHIVQTLPLCVIIAVGVRRPRTAGWFALPCFLFWLALMIAIWLYLLDLARLVTGHFTPLETAMTVVVGVAATAGITGAARFLRGVRAHVAASLFVLGAALQWVCFRLSTLPGIANR
jgi:hypothetical protein